MQLFKPFKTNFEQATHETIKCKDRRFPAKFYNKVVEWEYRSYSLKYKVYNRNLTQICETQK